MTEEEKKAIREQRAQEQRAAIVARLQSEGFPWRERIENGRTVYDQLKPDPKTGETRWM